MRIVRKYVALVAIGTIGLVPILSSGCAQQSAPSGTPGTTSPAPAKTETPKTTSTDTKPEAAKNTAAKKAKKKKPVASTAEAGSAMGGGVNPPVK